MSLFTEMCENLLPTDCEQTESKELTLLQEVSHAKTLAVQASELVSLIVKGTLPAPAYGVKCAESLAKLSPNGLWLKTSEGYFQSMMFTDEQGEDSERFCQAWPRWGIVLDGHAMGLPTSVRRTKGTGCLSWPIPTVADIFTAHSVNLSQAVNPEFAIKMWPTPDCSDRRSDNCKQKGLSNVVDKTNGQLNADWVECLMGFPVGWTDIDCDEPEPWQGWPAPLGVGQNWAIPNTMDSLPSRSYEAMKRQATNGGRKNRQLLGNLREQIDPVMRQAYVDARIEANGGKAPEDVRTNVNGQYPYEPPRVVTDQKNRAKRLKCLGNAVCPEQIEPIFAAIRAVKREMIE